jgi:hypothetical protein
MVVVTVVFIKLKDEYSIPWNGNVAMETKLFEAESSWRENQIKIENLSHWYKPILLEIG